MNGLSTLGNILPMNIDEFVPVGDGLLMIEAYDVQELVEDDVVPHAHGLLQVEDLATLVPAHVGPAAQLARLDFHVILVLVASVRPESDACLFFNFLHSFADRSFLSLVCESDILLFH